jgi:hypothetical protein
MKSIYVIQTQVIGIDCRPFPKSHLLRPSWQQIFCTPQCFDDQRHLIRDASWLFRDAWQSEMGLPKKIKARKDNEEENISFIKLPLPSMPFIRGLGSISFNTRRIHSKTYSERRSLAFELWDQKKKDDIDEKDISSWLLGYDRNIQDQRMNYLCFELARPLFLQAKTGNDIQATAKIFIHIFPSGYIVLHLVASLKWEEKRSLSAVHEILREVRPHHLNNTWHWSSRLGKESESLQSLIRKIYGQLEISLFADPNSKLHKSSQWRTFLRVTMEHPDINQISSILLGSHSSPKIINDLSKPGSRSGVQCLIVTPQGAACIFDHQSWCKTQAARRFFWKMSRIHEFVLVKEKIYEDYVHFMRDHVHDLQKWRRSFIDKAKEEDIFKFSVFDQQAVDYLLILDRHIHQTINFFRYIYPVFCEGTKIDKYRHQAHELIKEWDKEAQAWEHPLYAAWTRIVQPLQALLKSDIIKTIIR